MYAVKASWWLRLFAPRNLVWAMPPAAVPTVYLSFDDGPHPIATPFVLEQLARHNAKGTFFCIGKCIEEHAALFRQVQDAGHSIGNHTQNHLNGWKSETKDYLYNIHTAAALIPGRAFRPPYGRISRKQAKALRSESLPWIIYMWTVLSGDFDTNLSPEQCLDNVLSHIKPGAIIVFHDSAKAWDRLQYTLPHVLEYCEAKGWAMSGLPMNHTNNQEILDQVKDHKHVYRHPYTLV